MTAPRSNVQGLVLAQTSIGWEVDRNLAQILEAAELARRGDVVVTPEGSLSGYPTDGVIDELMRIDHRAVEVAMTTLDGTAAAADIAIWIGVVSRPDGRWVNEAIEVSSRGRRSYRKRNLAHHERGHFKAGTGLPLFPWSSARVGVQMCRELRFPEQWSALGLNGANIFLHMNNGRADASVFEIWRSMLIARAHETQRWVASANIADPDQHAPSMIVHPSGVIERELARGEEGAIRVEVDLSEIREDYLSQRVAPEAE